MTRKNKKKIPIFVSDCLITRKDKNGNIISQAVIENEQYASDDCNSPYDVISDEFKYEKSLYHNGHYYRCINEEEGIWERTR